MKTLYININNEQIQSNDELEVLKHDLDSDFFFCLGEKIAKGCKVENENALITDFNTQDNKEDYKQIIAQWDELKGILFSEECEGKFELTLPSGYTHWLKFHPQYVSVYDRNFSHGEPAVITIDLEELYEDSIEDLQRKILRKLQHDDLYLEIDEIVFNDDAVTRKSQLVCTIKEKYDGIGFKTYKKWLKETEESSKKDANSMHDDTTSEKPKNQSNDFIKDLSTKEWVEILEKYDEFSDLSEGLALVKLNGKYGFINKSGELVVPCIFNSAHDYKDGCARVGLNNKYGLINSSGEEITKIIYDFIGGFIEGIAEVCLNNKYGFIDFNGKEIFQCKYDGCHYCYDGVVVLRLDKKYGFGDKSGNLITPFIFDRVGDFHDGIATVKLNNKFGCINKKGEFVVQCVYDYIWDSKDGMCKVELNGSKGFVNNNGVLAVPCIYNKTSDFSEGLAQVELNGKYGFINKSGELVVPCKFDEAYDYKDDYAKVKLNGQYGFINKGGDIVIPNIYSGAENFCQGFACVEEVGGKRGIIDKRGNRIIDIPDNFVISWLNDNLLCLRHGWNSSEGVIDITGKSIVPLSFRKIEYLQSIKLIIAYNSRGDKCFYDIQGNFLLLK